MLERILKKTSLIDVPIVIIGAVAIVGIWRGTWNLLDKFLLPENFVYSQVASIIFGVLILIILSRTK